MFRPLRGKDPPKVGPSPVVLGEKSPNLAMIERLTVGLQTRTADL